MGRIQIPDKPYFRIGQVARLLGVETHVLRYWESQFPQLGPIRAPSGHRLYRAEDVRLLERVKRLVHEQGFTLSGAQKRLAELDSQKPEPGPAAEGPRDQVLSELKDILKIMD